MGEKNLEGFEKLSDDLMRIGSEIQQILASSGHIPQMSPMPNLLNISNAFMAGYQEFLKHPEKVNEASEQYMKDAFKLWQSTLTQMTGQEHVIEPALGDRRFKDHQWSDNPMSSYVLQSYLLYARWVDAVADDLEGLDEASRRKIRFYSRQFVDAIAPSNFAWTNPTVLKKTAETHGDNLVRGMNKFLEDLKNGTSLVNIKNTDTGAFEIGKDLATTPGKVIYQNDLMQLIQFEPSTEKVHQTPLLVVPAWINKYYILDLQPHNSFAKWLVDQGHTVFMISWVNPGPDLKDTDFEDYLRLGSLDAIRVIQEITGEELVNLIGFCLGGISLTVLLGALGHDAKKCIKSLTLMAAPIDFSQAGELTIFTDEDYMASVGSRLAETGLLDGAAMGATFNMLRANDLIWSAFINNYLLGNEQTQFDMLYWNADCTNMPGKMFNFYIQEMCLKNALMNKDQIMVLGRQVDISKAEVPVFLFASHDDHIAPWKSVYNAIAKLHGPVKFVLGESGHVAGVVNHPSKQKYGHWEHDYYGQDANDWLAHAKHYDTSWWLAWSKWSQAYQGKLVSQRVPGKGPYKAIEPAPGSYVKVTAEEALKN